MRVANIVGAAALLLWVGAGPVAAAALHAVAAERVYGDVLGQIGGRFLSVTTILNNPSTDPHAFEAGPAAARGVADADLVVYNGLAYDPWMASLLAASPRPGRMVLSAAALVGAKTGDNPHLWYDPRTMPAVAAAIADALGRIDPAGAAADRQRLDRFRASLAPIEAKIAAIRARYRGTAVTATEPVFGDMATALGLVMRNRGLQRAVMNGTEPGAADIAAFEDDLATRRVRLLLYNRQVAGGLADRLVALAKKSGVPVVGVAETEPVGETWQNWMLATLDAVEKALAGG